MAPSSRYPEQFRADAVALVHSSEQPVRQIARDLGVSPETLRGWVSAAKRRSAATGEPALSGDERDELRKLRARVRELE
ncbi:MAG: transposase, partial [Dactylosporangium sp.]|nr:transposase [Dactylosporangium sp.]NNJ59973.1 transposase [Dactylosporangium sp.]